MNSGIWPFWLVSEVRVNWVVWSSEMGKKIGLKNWAEKLGENLATIGHKWAEKNCKIWAEKLGKNLGEKIGQKIGQKK